MPEFRKDGMNEEDLYLAKGRPGLWGQVLYQEVLRLKSQYARIVTAIREHHDQNADDRCWMDDSVLYATAGITDHDPSVGDKAAMLKNCERFIEKRCLAGGTWVSYAELEADLARHKQWVADLQSGMYINCVYCGHNYGPGTVPSGTVADALKAHVEECVHHPMSKLKKERDALKDFKAFVHCRLDVMGIPADPDPKMTAATGCRIGQRLTFVEKRIELLKDALRITGYNPDLVLAGAESTDPHATPPL